MERKAPLAIANNKVNKESFYSFLETHNLRSPEQIKILKTIEQNIVDEFESENEYTTGDKPMITFFPELGNYFLRIELEKSKYLIKIYY